MKWILLLGLIVSCSYESLASEVNQANRLYRQGQYDQALPLYQKALDQDKAKSSALIHYDFGTALYKSGDYPKAIDHLKLALNDRQLKALPNYNLGNALYKYGDSLKEQNIDAAIGHLEEAVGQYQLVLNLDAKDKDAQYNLEFVQKKLEELRKQKQQKDQQKQDQQNKDQKKQEQSDSKDKNEPEKQKQEKKEDKKDQPEKQNQDQQKNQDQSQDSTQKNKEGDRNKDQGQKSKDDQDAKNQENDQQKEDPQEQVSKEELTKKEAREILEDYERSEEPKGLLNFIPKDKGERSVAKDW